MKKDLTKKELVVLASTLFGMFFGAGNLIFPALLGPTAGSNLWTAYLGLFITAVGMPLLAVVALGISRTKGVQELSSRVGRKYSVFFTVLLYLTIGPLFASPRCASTSFAVGASTLIGGANQTLALAIFSLVFFAIVLFFALKPNGIMTWIGRILNPAFLVFLGILIVVALFNPINSVASVVPGSSYATSGQAFLSGFLEGYNTLDALAGLAFGIIVINSVKSKKVEEPSDVARNTSKAGIFSCLGMGVIYLALTIVAAQSSDICQGCTNGGEILGLISKHYFGSLGAILMTLIVTLACLKTALGLVTSCSQTFSEMFPKGPSYKAWAVICCVVSFLVANLGLTSIVAYCVPVLMFIYPLAITLILLTLFGKFFGNAKSVYVWTTGFTLVAAFFDFLATLSSTLQGSGVANTAIIDKVVSIAYKVLPLSSYGLSWVVPAVIGCVIGLLLSKKRQKA